VSQINSLIGYDSSGMITYFNLKSIIVTLFEPIRSNCYPRINFINILLFPTDVSPTKISLYLIYSFYDENESFKRPCYSWFINEICIFEWKK
jgi:hypothetical protein